MADWSEPIAVRLRPDIENQIRRIATEEGNTLGAVVRRLLVAGLKASTGPELLTESVRPSATVRAS